MNLRWKWPFLDGTKANRTGLVAATGRGGLLSLPVVTEPEASMTARSHETIRVGLRRIIRDMSVKPNTRMDAIKLLMHVEGLMEIEARRNKPVPLGSGFPKSQKLRELLQLAEEKKTG